MKTNFGIDFIDDGNYSLGHFENRKLNGWGVKIITEGEDRTIIRGHFKDNELDGIGIIYYFGEEEYRQTAGFFKEGRHLNPQELTTVLEMHPYSWSPRYNGNEEFRAVKYYGTIAEDGYPRGFGYVVDENGVQFYIHYDKEGFRCGIFLFQKDETTFGEHLYTPEKTPLSSKEWAYIFRAGSVLKAKKLVKKYGVNKA